MKTTILVLIAALAFGIPATGQKKRSKATKSKPETVKVEEKVALPPPVKVTSVEGITEYLLHNGLRVLLFPDPSKQTVTVNVTYLVGSRHENYGETGMAHLLEHLVFKGTPKHPNIPQELSERGARPNGTTWTDRTNYFETFTATEDNLKWALELEADRMVNSFISKADLDSEMTVVRNELESGENNPFRILMQRVMSTAYLWHNYGKSTIGARSDLENVAIERLQAFYRKYYQPDNAILTVAGKIDEAKTLEMVNEAFGVVPRPTRVLEPSYTLDPTQDGERSVVLRRVGDIQLAMTAYHIPAVSHPDFAAIQVLTEVLGSEPSGRLYKALVDSKEATSSGAFAFQWKEPGLLLTYAEVLKDASAETALNTMRETLDKVVDNPPTDEEVERARNEILKSIDLMFNSSELIGLRLSEAIGSGDWRLLFLGRDRIKDVTVEDVKRVAGQYLKRDNRTTGMFIPTDKPDRAEIPPAPNVAELVKDYKGGEGVAMGEEFDPAPSNIESRTVRAQLPNGMELAMLPKKTRGESVEARITIRYGDLSSLINKSTVAEFAASMLDKGTSKHTRQQLKDAFDRLKANVHIGGGATQTSVSISTTRPNLAEVLDIVGEILKEASFPADEFEKLKSERLAGVQSQKSNPQAIALTEIQRHISPYPAGDPRYVETFDESESRIKAAALSDVKDFHKNFYGMSDATMSVVGDFDADAIRDQVNKLFGNWKSPKAFDRIKSKAIAVETINRSFETPDKANAFFVGAYNFEFRDDNPDYPALVLGNYMLGGGFLNSRLATRIRQKEGLSYGVGSQFSAGSLDPVGSFFAYAIYAPENAGKLEEAFREEIEKVITEGFTEEEVAAAKSGWLQSRNVSRAQDGGLAGSLNHYLYIDRNFSWDEAIEKKVADLTVADINNAMKKYLSVDRISIIKAGDFAKARQPDSK